LARLDVTGGALPIPQICGVSLAAIARPDNSEILHVRPAMEVSSIVVLTVIGMAVLIVSFRTAKYNRARDRAYTAYRKTVEMLRPELEANLELVSTLRGSTAADQNADKTSFATEHWKSLSLDAQILSEMDRDDSSALRDVYDLIAKVETYRGSLDGPSDQISPSVKEQLDDVYRRSLDELMESLERTLARVR
jgi:hypothetical protein